MGSDMGVFVGVMSVEWADVPRPASVYGIGGHGHCFVCGRISYVLGLQGACIAYDTACSSSLAACHTALRAQQAGECATALLGGTHAMLMPTTPILYARGDMLSRRGRSHAFDARADGFGRGEACELADHVCGNEAMGDRFHGGSPSGKQLTTSRGVLTAGVACRA